MKKGEVLYKGKAKSLYRTGDPGVLLVEFRDDITAFDGQKKDVLSSKGRLNAQVSAFLFRLLERNGIATHFIDMPDESHMLVKALDMIPLEVIVRNIAAGSLVRQYPFREGTVLEPPVIVIDYKDDSRHDPMLNDDLIIALGILTPDDLAMIKEMALRVNSVLREFFASLGITLVDFKIEFGRTPDGKILLGDEISMDSMRLWDMSTGKSLDKDVYRFSKGDVMEAYNRVAERVCAEDKEVCK
ncbi:MAG TPA: phosphoribosylaminoimidazolesuccinocarboxamide synthase [Methanolinea sp.]|nr:phosphoribosylaminoimidazolesuccinocarboxamide synthase [Methanolinea sp.]HPC54673.1 phosphoribosylaminoimidazolesuccinocarboxamide synthase [Methanolinea sp.]HQE85039.1 phosphoribosylaminoimidazolesuccinocarboxamide synthase [Methanolinea sp.]HQI13981.1 phosphoribosylaminoimidazolesuccinocarboxamide synthase [Methanolinea sp.]HQJ17968.1 phosphoribosylaminoimidazolesuccinocarboxamide synthase [Methanolinea sp.]